MFHIIYLITPNLYNINKNLYIRSVNLALYTRLCDYSTGNLFIKNYKSKQTKN